MFTYILFLLAVSLVLIVVYAFPGKSIPVEPPVYYASVGFSLLLSMALPRLLVELNVFAVIAVYVLSIGFFAAAFTVIREKLLARHIPADPESAYVGKAVGLLVRDDGPPEEFSRILARQMEEGEAVAPVPPVTQARQALPDNGARVREQEGTPVPAPAAPAEDAELKRTRPATTALQERERYAGELRGLFRELGRRPPPRERAGLILRLAGVYRELGEYWQAVEVIRTFLRTAGNDIDGQALNSLIVTAAWCQAILLTLRSDGDAGVPYRDLAEGTRARAATLAGRLIIQGGWQGEEIAGNH